MTADGGISRVTQDLIEIQRSRDYSLRVSTSGETVLARFASAINGILANVEADQKSYQIRLRDLTDAVSDGTTVAAHLRQTKELLKLKSNQLDQALAKAEALSDAKSHFLANVSHEIRTPMNGILGMGEVLLRTELNDRQRQLTRTITESGRALLTIINDILDFSKIESGKIEFKNEPFSPRHCIMDVIALLQVQAANKGLTLATEIAVAVPQFLMGDPGRFRQVITNLLGNAIKFTENGGVTIKADWQQGGTPETLFVEIIDTGVGIPEDKLPLIFEKFNQVDNTSTRRHEGTGLGLTISKLLLEGMGGQIGVRSRYGEGSCFYFGLPLSVASPNWLVADDVTVLAGRSVLLLLETENDGSGLRQSLTDLNLAVQVWNGAGAPPKQKFGYDFTVIVCDWLDDRTRSKVRSARKLPNGASGVILLFCESAMIGDADTAVQLGAAAYISGRLDSDILSRSLILARHTPEKKPGLLTRHSVNEALLKLSLAQPEDCRSVAFARQYKILVVDDSAVNRQVATEFLTDLGCEIVHAENGSVALQKFSETRFDAILMDCQMPVMDGFEATAAIRKLEADRGLAKTPIVALTANAFSADQSRCLSIGMDAFLSKPLDPDLLESTLKRVLEFPAIPFQLPSPAPSCHPV